MKTPMKAAFALCAMAACGDVDQPQQQADPPDARDLHPYVPDGSTAPKRCDPLARFGAPQKITSLSTPDHTEAVTRLSPDELTVYFETWSSGVPWKLYVARRASKDDAFPTPSMLTAVTSTANDFDPSISTDGLTLWFGSDRDGGVQHLYVATRASVLGEFGAPQRASLVNSDAPDGQPFLTADGGELWFTSNRAPSAGRDIWRASKIGDAFGAPVAEPALDSSAEDWLPMLSADRLTIYFASNRGGGGAKGDFEIYRAHRANVDDGFPAPTLVDELNTAGADLPGWLSPDDCRIYTYTDGDVYVATRSL